MKLIILAFTLFLSFISSSFAHDMPDSVKKEKLLDALVQYDIIKFHQKAQVASSYKTDFSMPELLIPLSIISLGPEYNWSRNGDQDFEEFHMTYKLDGNEYSLNCDLRTEELMDEDPSKVKYTLGIKDCIHENVTNGTKEKKVSFYGEFSGKLIQWEKDKPYKREKRTLKN